MEKRFARRSSVLIRSINSGTARELCEGVSWDIGTSMADPKESGTLVSSTGSHPGISQVRRQRLAVMPLAVLLPSLGNLTDIHLLRPHINRRLEELQAEAAASAGEDDNEIRRKRLAEESMLNQVLQWLSVGSEE